MRSAVVGSGLFHIALLSALLLVRRPASTVVAGPDVVQVALLEPAAPAPAPAPPPPPAVKPAPEKQVVKPDEAKGVRITPPKPKPAPPKAPPAVPPPAAPEVALPYAPVGNAGLRSQVAVDATDFEFTYYLVLIRNRIAENWTPPSGAGKARAVVFFRIGRGGAIEGVQLESGSGIEFFDQTALRAVVLSDPLPALPLGYTGADLGIHLGFEYAAP